MYAAYTSLRRRRRHDPHLITTPGDRCSATTHPGRRHSSDLAVLCLRWQEFTRPPVPGARCHRAALLPPSPALVSDLLLHTQTERCGQIRPARSTALPSAPHPSAYAMPVQALDFERTVASAGAGDTAAGLHDVATSLMALSVPPSPPSPSPPPPPRGSTCSALYNTAGARASISMSHAHEPP